VDVKLADVWIRQVAEKFAGINQFQNSEHYSGFAEWEENLWNDLEQWENEIPDDFMNEAYREVHSILSEAREEINWTGQGKPAFDRLMADLIYPHAWIWWDAQTYAIPNDLIPGCEERSGEIFTFPSDEPDPLPTLSIALTRLSVDPGAMVYVGNALASNLHLMCNVPAIPNDLDATATVQRVLDPNLERNQWQRALISNRVKHIQSFLTSGNAFFVNPVIIHLDEQADPNSARIITDSNNKSTLQINFANFSSQGRLDGGNRPLQLIDGQHRVRGAARSTMGHLLEIPFILIPPTYAPDNAAKLFTEINTTSKELDKDHQLFLAYRFNISHHDRDLTMGRWIPEMNNHHDRANRMAYRMAAILSSEGAPLASQIQMLKSNGTTNCVDITKWLKYAKKWFLPGGPYDSNSGHDDGYIHEELENYFSAWVTIIGDSWIKHGNPGWKGRTIFQQRTHFRVLLTRFSQIHSLTRNRVGDGPFTEADFLDSLKPIKNLKSDSAELRAAYLRTSEFYWQCMDAWVKDALEHGTQYPEEQVMSTSIRSQPGRGVLSPPARPEDWIIEDDPNGNWPTGRSRYVSVQRPINCHSTLTIQILNGEEVLSGISRTSINGPNSDGSYRVPIRAGIIQNDVDEIQVRLEWKNAIRTLVREITIQRPD
jgi:DGQHR domain-containing protein